MKSILHSPVRVCCEKEAVQNRPMKSILHSPVRVGAVQNRPRPYGEILGSEGLPSVPFLPSFCLPSRCRQRSIVPRPRLLFCSISVLDAEWNQSSFPISTYRPPTLVPFTCGEAELAFSAAFLILLNSTNVLNGSPPTMGMFLCIGTSSLEFTLFKHISRSTVYPSSAAACAYPYSPFNPPTATTPPSISPSMDGDVCQRRTRPAGAPSTPVLT